MTQSCRFRFGFLIFTILSIVLFSSFSCSSAEDDAEADSSNEKIAALIVKDEAYGEDPGQVYDFYLPAQRSSSKTKILVFLHGGGWIGGDKIDMDPYIPLLQNDHPDHAIVNMNYRLAQIPDQPAFPHQFLDLQRALEQITERAEEYKVKPIFGIIGVSAGAHLALQYDALYDEDDRVKMICSIVGPTDLTDPFYTHNKDFDLAIDFLVDESSYPGTKNYERALSPLFHVSKKSSATILFYGEKDPLVPLSSGIALHEKLDSIGVSNSLTIFKGGHGDWEKEENKTLQLKLKTFIDLHLPIY